MDGNDPTAALLNAISDMKKFEKETDALRRRAIARLEEIRPLLIGRRLRRFGRIYQIPREGLYIDAYGALSCYGVTVSPKGAIGTRAFSIGRVALCELLEEPK